MAYVLTADELSDLQSDLGISADESVFTDADLNRFFTRASGDFETSKVYAYRRLLSNAQLLFDYTIGQTQEKRSQVFNHLKTLLDDAEEKAGMIGNITGSYIDLQNIVTQDDVDEEYGL